MPFLNESDLTEIEQVIYEELKELQSPNSPLGQKLQELQKIFNQYSQIADQGSYHDRSRFGFLESMASSEYRILQRAKIEREQTKIIEQMYDLSIEITNELMQRQGPLNYAIYFKDKDGHIYRTQQDKIELDTLNISKSNQSLRLSAAAFKKKALEQKQAVDITEHYATFMGVLQKTYNGQTKLANKKINEGIIAEAFERHLQKIHAVALQSGDISIETGYDWSVDEAWRLIRQSMGNDPWYTGGDVGMTQVKNIGKGNVRLTQFNTIEDIVNFLIYLGKAQTDDNILRKQAKEVFKILYNEANNNIDDFVNMTVDQLIDPLLT